VVGHHIYETVIIKEQIPSEWDIGTVQHVTDQDDSYLRTDLKISTKPCFQILKAKVYYSSIFLQFYLIITFCKNTF
jgi:hypothetical protein